MPATQEQSMSARELARYWKVSRTRIRDLIRRGLLVAIDFGFKGPKLNRPYLRFTPQSIAECEQRLRGKSAPARRKRAQTDDPELVARLNARPRAALGDE